MQLIKMLLKLDNYYCYFIMIDNKSGAIKYLKYDGSYISFIFAVVGTTAFSNYSQHTRKQHLKMKK